MGIKWKLVEMQFFKKILFPVNENGFRAFFLLVETIIEFRRNPIF